MADRKRKKDASGVGAMMPDTSTKRRAHIISRQKETEQELLLHREQLEKRGEEHTRELAKESTRRRALFEQAQIAICVIDENFKVVEANASFASMLGYTLDEVLQLRPWDWDVVYSTRKKLLARWPELPAEPMTFETKFRRKNGAIFDAEVIHNLAEFEDTKALFLVCRDITTRKHTEQSLYKQEKYSQSLLNLSKNLERAQTYGEMLNAARDEVRNIIGYQNLWAYLFSEDKKYAGALIAGGPISDKVMSEEGITTLTIHGDRMLEEIAEARTIVVVEDARTDPRTNKEIVARLGNRTIVNVPIILLDRHMGSVGVGTFGDEGVRVPTKSEEEYLRTLASHMAVTLDRIQLLDQRRRTDEALRESEARFRVVADTTPVLIWMSGTDKLCNYFNKTWLEFTGRAMEQELGNGWAEGVHPDDLSRCLAIYVNAFDKRESFAMEYRLRHASGEYGWIYDQGVPRYSPEGLFVGYIGSCTDITERKRVENIRQARLRLLEFASSHSMDELLTATLDEIESLTGSAISFYHFLELDQKTLILQNWSTNTLKNMCNAEGKGSHYDIDQAGVWVDCVRERHPVIHNDYVSLPHRKGMPEGHAPVVREIVVPIFRGSLIKAIIGVGNKVGDYHEGDVEIASQLGDLSLDIVERKRVEEKIRLLNLDLEQRVVERTAQLDAANQELSVALRETKGLFSTVQDVLTSTHLTQVYQNLMEHFIDLVKADRITLYLVDHQRQEILLNLVSGNSQRVVPMTYQELSAGIAGQVFKSGQPVLSLSTDDGLELPETYERRIHDNIGSLIVVPLLTRKGAGALRVIGVVTVINRFGQRVFTQHDKDLLMMMATQAATAVENIRLYEETSQRVAELELLYQSGLAFSQLTTPKAIAQKIIDLLNQKMDWHHTAIRLYHPETKTLELLAFNLPTLNNREERSATEKRFKTIQRFDQGLSGWVVQHGQTVRSNDLKNDPRYFETYPDIQSGLYIPIKTAERIIGVISIESKQPQAFNESDERLTLTLAVQAATAIENIRLYEKAQIARDAADAANQSKSDFLANMSHEIRTPMNAILGLTQLVLDTNLDAMQRNYLQKVSTSSKALLGILNDILDYSKIEAGKLDLEAVDFDLDELLNNTSELFSIGTEEKGIELVFDVAPEAPMALNGDPLRLSQILNNLVGNAIKFTEQGEILVKVEIEKNETGKTWLQFSVRDTGIGMTKDQIARLFHAFSQADSSTTRKFGGTGLGLTISQRLVNMMEGEINVKSVQGKGSTFYFKVPLCLAHNALPLRNTGDLRGMKTLVVDDQEASLRVMDSLLNAWSFDVTLATSGLQGLQMITKAAQSGHPFELLLIDWKMPNMDGLELARRVRDLSTQIGRPPLVIMVTAFGREDVLKAADANQIDAILDKPVIPSHLFDVLVDLQKGSSTRPRTTPPADTLDLFEAARPIHGARILIVEDNVTNQLVARGFLEKMALVVDVASDGQEAVDKIAAQDYDAVLMDLQMPKMDGFEAARRIRSMERGRNLPIIAMTADVMQKDKDAAEAAGMNSHVSKPINREELVSVLMRWVPHQLGGTEKMATPEDGSAHSDKDSTEMAQDFDLNIALSWLGGDRVILKQILTTLRVDLAENGQGYPGCQRAWRLGGGARYCSQDQGNCR